MGICKEIQHVIIEMFKVGFTTEEIASALTNSKMNVNHLKVSKKIIDSIVKQST